MLTLKTDGPPSDRSDPLTGAANRTHFVECIGRLIQSEAILLVAKLDIRRFHDINFSYGYDAGDRLLAEIADRLRSVSGTVIGRLGANEFGIAVPLAAESDAAGAVERIRNPLRHVFDVNGRDIKLAFALGYAVGTADSEPITLIRNAGVALHEAKSPHARGISVFSAETDEKMRTRMQLTEDLGSAVVDREFVLHFQPKVRLDTGAIIGVEGLVRWEHPVQGLLSPDRFIGIAEDTGHIVEIGHWALQEAARFAKRLNANRAHPVRVAVNVSPIEFQHHDMAELVSTVLKQAGVDPDWMTLELTESLFLESSANHLRTFRRLRDLGVDLAVDDFGTGYSSLRYLEAFPVSEIKIDQAFTRDLHANSRRQAIVRAVIGLGRDLGSMVTAEGVETTPERNALRDAGCWSAQGYLFSPPLDERALLRFVESNAS